MKRNTFFLGKILWLFLALLCRTAVAQVVVKGTVYDKQARYGVRDVSVLSTSGIGTATDTLGHYSIKVPGNDSIYFSYLGKTTVKFPVKQLPPDQPLDISLPVSVDLLPSVTVYKPSYRADSIANREEYKKVFDYDEGMYLSNSGGFGVGIGFDLIFNGRQIRRMEHFRARLEREERDKYIDHRFNKALVKRITNLTSPMLDSFMVEYRPTYETLQSFETDYEYYKYIKDFYQVFMYEWKQKHPGEMNDSTFRADSTY
jgi:hypothetical protein